MKIQEILFPQVGRCTEEELYFRRMEGRNGTAQEGLLAEMMRAGEYLENRKLVFYDEKSGRIKLLKGGRVWFDTYFNGFSIGKWRKYTTLSQLSLKLRLSGKVRVTLYVEEEIFQNINKTVLAQTVVEYGTPEEKPEDMPDSKLKEDLAGRALPENAAFGEFRFDFPKGDDKGMYSFEIEALSDECVFCGGSYFSDIPAEKQRKVTIGAGICTFRREAFVEKNIELLRKHILENPDCPMCGHLEVFIADNGRTLDADRLRSEHIHIYPNRNLGGAGGFTRTLIEMKKRKDLQVTHALLMDDDIVIEPEALVKTWTILTLVKEEYLDAFIGGAMLRLDRQSIQVESGAAWNGGMLNSLKAGLDLRILSACLYNEVEEYTEYNAWWYCCFPMDIVREDNLPLPIFIRGDDLEYGLRNMKTLILMNGICAWHEPFEYKYSSSMEYYIIRNQLIDNAFHCPWYGAKQLKKAMMTHCKQEIMFYRYKNVDLYIRGIEDFLKGPKWLMEQDGEALHKEIMNSGYKAAELQALDMPFQYPVFDASVHIQDTTKARVKRILTLNGLLLPARGEAIVPVAALKSIMFYRKKRVMHYDAASRKAFVTRKSNREAWKCIYKTLKLNRKISRRLAGAQQAYREEGLKLRTLEFWNKFLGLV